MVNEPLARLDVDSAALEELRSECRLSYGEIWEDSKSGHRVLCGDATDKRLVQKLCQGHAPSLAIHDPPYNLVAFDTRSIDEYVTWCRQWITLTHDVLAKDASLYVWLGADQNEHFQPLPDFMLMMRATPFASRSLITMRNQRGYGTQLNWMAIRQELLYYTKGKPSFNVEAEYTDIPRILKGYYKNINGEVTENSSRSKSETIRAGNVWVDIQQVFYRLHENVSGCYAQKPLAAVDRCVRASSRTGETVIDLFAHSGTTLLSCETLDRKCFTCDIEPVFCEIAIRRLEHFRNTGRTGWQNSSAFRNAVSTNGNVEPQMDLFDEA